MMVCAAAWRQGPQTSSISGHQGKNTCILGYRAKRPEKGKKYFLSRAKKPDNQWFGFACEAPLGKCGTRQGGSHDYIPASVRQRCGGARRGYRVYLRRPSGGCPRRIRCVGWRQSAVPRAHGDRRLPSGGGAVATG